MAIPDYKTPSANLVSKAYLIASYPRSGSTWLRLMLANLIAGQGVGINELDLPWISSREVFDLVLGFSSSDLTSQELDNLRAPVYHSILAGFRQKTFVKVHDQNRTAGQDQLFGGAGVAGVIYLCRHPADVCVSLANHLGISLQESLERMNDSDFALFDSVESLGQVYTRLGTWSGHINSYLNAGGLRLLTIRYEDLFRFPEMILNQVGRFAGLNCSRVSAAVAATTFEKLRRAEKEQGFREGAGGTTPFFRAGHPGQGQVLLNTCQLHQLETTHKDTMRIIAYL
ncbi:MAG: aryl sulfotransferase [Rhodothermales bacterium]|jgi:aryl sulfotransferase